MFIDITATTDAWYQRVLSLFVISLLSLMTTSGCSSRLKANAEIVTCDQFSAAVQNEQVAFRGMWINQEIYRDGEKVAGRLWWTFSAGECTLDEMGNPQKLLYRIDPGAVPCRIDLIDSDGKLRRGIYRFVDKDHLIIAFGDSDASAAPGPSAFDPHRASHAATVLLEREE
jgi:uncharacterized protein (TIGR03067 family)